MLDEKVLFSAVSHGEGRDSTRPNIASFMISVRNEGETQIW